MCLLLNRYTQSYLELAGAHTQVVSVVGQGEYHNNIMFNFMNENLSVYVTLQVKTSLVRTSGISINTNLKYSVTKTRPQPCIVFTC